MPSPIRRTQTCVRAIPSSRSYHSPVVSYYERHHYIPPYPYGRATQYKQRDTGLYGNSQIQYGNKVSERNEIKTRRVWRPNIHHKRLWSDALQKFVEVKVQARVVRTIDKVGGLDEYLLGEKAGRIKELGVEGWALRWKIMQTEAVKERIGRNREALGLPREGWEQRRKMEREQAKTKALNAAMKYVDIGKKMAQEEAERSVGQADALFDGKDESVSAVLEKEVDAVAQAINEDLRAVEIDFPPLPENATTAEDSWHHESEDAASKMPRHPSWATKTPKQTALFTAIETLALKAHSTLPKILEEARQILADKATKKAAAAERRRELQKPRRQRREEQLAYEPHPEIEDAIKNSTAQELHQRYRTQQREELIRLRKQREAQVRTIANQIWTRLKRGEGGRYVKRTAWDLAYKRATKRVGPLVYVSPRSVAGLTIGQWLRLREGVQLEEEKEREKGSSSTLGAGKNRVTFSDWWKDVKRNLVTRRWLRGEKANVEAVGQGFLGKVA
ncbi:MAG: hypothetical protein Q9163_005443 [Psora crenata]